MPVLGWVVCFKRTLGTFTSIVRETAICFNEKAMHFFFIHESLLYSSRHIGKIVTY